MTSAAPAPRISRSVGDRGGRRAQEALAIGVLVAAVLGTVVLVVSPASTGPTRAGAAEAASLPRGTAVEVRGGDPHLAHVVADRLTGAGATVGAVVPAASREAVEPATTIVYYDRRSLAAAGRVRDLLGGTGTLRRRQVFQPGVDVTIVLGKDLPHL